MLDFRVAAPGGPLPIGLTATGVPEARRRTRGSPACYQALNQMLATGRWLVRPEERHRIIGAAIDKPLTP